MMLNAYSIFDTAAGVFQRPWFVGADGEATRIFSDLCKDESSTISKHPEDYHLFRIGRFNDRDGMIDGDTPERLASGTTVVHGDKDPEA